MNKILVVLSAAVLLTGCSFLQPNAADQAKGASSADKDAAIVCATVTGMGGQAKVVVVKADKGVAVNSTVTVDGDCKVTAASGSGVKQ